MTKFLESIKNLFLAFCVIVTIFTCGLFYSVYQDRQERKSAHVTHDAHNNMQEDNSAENNATKQSDDVDVPKGYKRTEDGDIMLDAPILGMEWESVQDPERLEIISERDGKTHASPFTIFQCETTKGENISLDTQNTLDGFQLLYYRKKGDDMVLESKQLAQNSYFLESSNAKQIFMPTESFWYLFTEYEDGSLLMAILDAKTGREEESFECLNNDDDNTIQTDLIDQLVPKHFNFLPVTDEVIAFIRIRFKMLDEARKVVARAKLTELPSLPVELVIEQSFHYMKPNDTGSNDTSFNDTDSDDEVDSQVEIDKVKVDKIVSVP